MTKRRLRRVRMPTRLLLATQRQLGIESTKMMKMVDLANVICERNGVPGIGDLGFRKKEAAKRIIIKYMQDIGHISAPNKVSEAESTYCIYFIQQGGKGPIKVGMTSDVDARINSLQTANPYKLTLIKRIYARSKAHAVQLERYVHRCFSYARMDGEWFMPHIKDKLISFDPDLPRG